MSRLAALLGPIPVDRFLSETWGRGVLHVRGDGRRFDELLTWAQLGAIVAQHRPDTQRIRVFREGVSVRPDAMIHHLTTTNRKQQRVPRLRGDELLRELRRGATLVIDGVDELHGPITTLAEDLERELGDPVLVNLYATWHTTRGFRMHWDDHDLLVVQVSGCKRWVVHEPTRPAPLEDDVERPTSPTGDPIWEGEVDAGDVLYVPRGFWHYAQPIGGPTVHLTFGVYRRTGIDLMRWISDELRRVELFRHSLPRTHHAAHAASLRRELLAIMDDGVVARFLDDHDRRTIPRPHLDLPWAATEDILPPDDSGEVRLDLLRPAALRSEDLARDPATIRLHDRDWTFEGDDLRIVRILADGRWYGIESLSIDPGHGLTAGRARAAVRRLCAGGICVTRSRS